MQITIFSGTFLNISLTFSNLVSSKLFKLIYSKLVQSKNIPCTSVTNEVLKLDKSNEVNDEQPLNIWNIDVTFWVLKLDKFNEVKDEQ